MLQDESVLDYIWRLGEETRVRLLQDESVLDCIWRLGEETRVRFLRDGHVDSRPVLFRELIYNQLFTDSCHVWFQVLIWNLLLSVVKIVVLSSFKY